LNNNPYRLATITTNQVTRTKCRFSMPSIPIWY